MKEISVIFQIKNNQWDDTTEINTVSLVEFFKIDLHPGLDFRHVYFYVSEGNSMVMGFYILSDLV